MKFAVLISGKKYPVTVMREPNNTSALSNFECEGRTYKGVPSQFNGLSFNKTKNCYTATSVIVTEVVKMPIEVKRIVVKEEITIPLIEEIPEEVVETPIEEEVSNDEIERQIIESSDPEPEPEQAEDDEDEEGQDPSAERKQAFLEELAEESAKIRRLQEKELERCRRVNRPLYVSRWGSIFPEAEAYGEGLFKKQQLSWIKQHGSEHLKMAFEMRCKCDCLYIQERAAKEFPEWAINDLLVYYEIDSPDLGELTFLKNFGNLYKDMLNAFRSKIILATTDIAPDEQNPTVVITDYLGHCDLSIMLVDLVGLYGDRC